MRLSLLLLLIAAGCGSKKTTFDFDAGLDFSLPKRSTLVGRQGVTCCMVTSRADFAMYLLDPQPSEVDSRGIQRPARGELHIVNAYGNDYTIAADVPVFAYGFSPDGRYALFISKSTTKYKLGFVTVTRPDFTQQPKIHTAVMDGLQDYKLFEQSFYSPTGRYLILGVLPPRTANSPDLHVVDMLAGTDVYQLDKGAFSYLEMFGLDDTMVFENSTHSTVAGVPSVQGLYVVNLPAAIHDGAKPALIDERVGPASYMADLTTVIYLKHNGDLMLWNGEEGYHTRLAANALSFTTGPNRRGPIAWVGTDGSLHVQQLLGKAVQLMPAGSVDVFSTLQLSPDGQRLYYFRRVSSQDRNGEMWTVSLQGAPDPKLVGVRVSSRNLDFFGDRLITVHNVDGRGDAGDLVSSRWDGSNPLTLQKGVQLSLRYGFPEPLPPSGPQPPYFGPKDMREPDPLPIVATLSATRRDSTTNVPIDDREPLLGTLSLGRDIMSLQETLAPNVMTGSFRFSDDSYVIAYVRDAQWSDAANNYIGKLELRPTMHDVAIEQPDLTGVGEIGPIVDRQMFVSAPQASRPGIYFVRY